MPVASVSICIPTYEQPESFRRTLESVLGQEYGDYEVVVTDDSRDDAVEAVVRDVADPRVRFRRNERRLGSPENWNAAVAESRAPLVKLLHHDDWLTTPESLGAFVALLDDPEMAFGFSASAVSGNTAEHTRLHQPEPYVDALRRDVRVLLGGNWIGAPSATIFRRDGTRFDARLKWVVDVDFYLAFLSNGRRIAFDSRPLVTTTHNAPEQITTAVRDDRDVELYEWLYLYGKWAPRPALRGLRARFMHELLRKYGVRSFRDVRDLPLHGRARRLLRTACALDRVGALQRLP